MSSQSFLISCGRAFTVNFAFSNHQKSCKSSKKRIAGALDSAQAIWRYVRTTKTQATPRQTAGRKEEAKKVKGQGDKTPRKEKRRRKQLKQWKWPAMPMKYWPLPARPTTLKSQTLSTFPNPDLVHASTVAQVDITALTAMHSSITLQSITPPSQLPTVANSKRSEKAMCGSSYWMVQSAPRPYSRRQYMLLTWHLLSSR